MELEKATTGGSGGGHNGNVDIHDGGSNNNESKEDKDGDAGGDSAGSERSFELDIRGDAADTKEKDFDENAPHKGQDDDDENEDLGRSNSWLRHRRVSKAAKTFLPATCVRPYVITYATLGP